MQLKVRSLAAVDPNTSPSTYQQYALLLASIAHVSIIPWVTGAQDPLPTPSTTGGGGAGGRSGGSGGEGGRGGDGGGDGAGGAKGMSDAMLSHAACVPAIVAASASAMLLPLSVTSAAAVLTTENPPGPPNVDAPRVALVALRMPAGSGGSVGLL